MLGSPNEHPNQRRDSNTAAYVHAGCALAEDEASGRARQVRHAATRLAALVVLYRPTAVHVEHLLRLSTHCECLLAVDNSPNEDPDLAHGLAGNGIGYLFNANRGGIAGAYNKGLARLFAQGFDAVALFDQDSRVSDDYFPVMHESCATLGARAYAIGPRIYDENAQSFLPEMLTNGFTIGRPALDFDTALQRCSFLLSSGSVVSRLAYERLGTFAERLFIDHVDTEYSLRALARGVPFYIQPRLILAHRIGNKRKHRLAFLHLTSMNHPPLRRYYMARNGMHLCLQYFLSFPIAIVPNLITAWQVLQISMFEEDKLAKLLSIGCGVVDGLLGRLGPIELVRPRLAARIARASQCERA
jgi:rhamnosyltransferase